MDPSGRSVLGYRFATFEVDLRSGELRKNGIKIRLQDQPLKVLCILLEQPGEVVLREELQRRLWPADTFVDFDHSLNTAINRIREALSDSADNPRFVQTIPRRGYRFLAPVEVIEEARATEASADPTPSPIPRRPGHAAWRVWFWRYTFAVLALLAVFGYFYGWRLRRSRALPAGRILLAVLPFANLSGDAAQEFFGDGLTEEMISQLGRVNPERLAVIARTTAMRYKNTAQNVEQIGKELGVDYLVEGSFRRAGDRVRISAKLVQVSGQTPLWTQEYDIPLSDILQMQTQAAQAVAMQISVQLYPRRQPAAVNPEAYETALRGRYYWNKRADADLLKSAQLLESAVAKDPDYALAHAWLAESYHLLGYYSVRKPEDAYPQARAAAKRALEFDDTLGEAHTTLADVAYLYEYDWKGAEREFRQALTLSPNNSTTHQWYGDFLLLQDRFAEGRAEIEKARALDLLSPVINADLGLCLYYQRDYPAAVAQFRRTIELEPGFSQTHAWLGMALLQMGGTAEALEEFHKGVQLSGSSQGTVALEGYGLARAGRKQEALDHARQLEASARQRYVSPIYIALVYIALGDKQQVFAWADKAYHDRSPLLARMKVEPLADPVRNDPRFGNLMARIGLGK